MSIRYSEDLKKEVVKAYMSGDKSTIIVTTIIRKMQSELTQSMSRAGCPYDNAPMERFYNTFKSNFYNVTAFSSMEMMDELTMKYINWYNYVRPHSYNDYLTPMEARYR